jgi:soluble lytic murein transglycosylase-like protein
MNITNICWIVMLNIMSPNASPSYQKKISSSLPNRLKICKQVAKEAKRQQVDPALAIAVAYHETRFENITSHKGAQGPLGVLPQYHCPKKGKCDHTKAGIFALKKFLNLNHQKKCTALAQYNRGLKGKCKQGRSEYKYAHAVIDTFNEIIFFNQESCFDKPIK